MKYWEKYRKAGKKMRGLKAEIFRLERERDILCDDLDEGYAVRKELLRSIRELKAERRSAALKAKER